MIEATQVKEGQLKKLRPAVARAQLRLSQGELAAIAGVSQRVISRSENGLPIRLLIAVAILDALNQERAKRGMTPLELEEVDWRIQGEE